MLRNVKNGRCQLHSAHANTASCRRPDLAASLATITDAAAPNAAPEGDVPVDVTVEMEPLRARFLSRGELDEGRNAP